MPISTTLSPTTLDPALLGICHWMGYRHQLYRHYPLTEGALVSELAGLLSAHLDSSLSVVLEQSYSTLAPGGVAAERADIVIGPRSTLSELGRRTVVTPIAAIEVKRSKYNDWSKDLAKLSRVWSTQADWTAWILLLDQAISMQDAENRGWVGPNGRASRRRQSWKNLPYVVRRVTRVRSAHANTVHRAVLLELV